MSKQRNAAILAVGLSAWLAVALLAAAAVLFLTNQAAAQSTDSSPSTPALTAEAGDDGVDLSWTAVTGAARYELWAWTSADGWYDIGGDNLTGTTFTHSDVTDGTTYWYAVRAVNAGGDESDWSAYASATAGTQALPAPTLTAQAAANGIDLSWTAVTGATRYGLWVWDSVNLWQQIGGDNLTGTAYTHTDVTEGTTYWYAVRAVNVDGDESAWSTYTPATMGSAAATPTATPTLQTQQQQGDEPTATFTPTPTATLKSQDQQQRNELTATPTSTATSTATPTPTAEQPGQNVPATGAPSISGTAEVCKTLTAVVTNIMDENGMVNASFSYNWYAGGGYFRGAVVRDPNYIVQSRDVGLTISVTVNFDDDAGNSETVSSLETGTVIAATNPGKPKAPVQVRVQTPASGKLLVSWTHPYSINCGDGGSTVTGFKVQWKEAADDWNTTGDVSEATVAYESLNASYTISGLTNGEEYTVRVLATNAIGDGAASSVVTATP